MSFGRVFFLGILVCSLNSCSQDPQPKVYRIAKENSKPPQTENTLPPPPKPSTPIIWKTPNTWTEQPAQGMRTGSLLIKDNTGKEVDVSIIYLGGIAGGDLANVNRWRDQIALKPWSEKEFIEHSTGIDTALGKGKLVAFANLEKDTRIVAAIIPHGEGTWFFKMMGVDSLATENQAQFLDFISSVRFARE